MKELTIGDYFERIVTLVRSAVDLGMDLSEPGHVRAEIVKELDCFLAGPTDHECDAAIGAIAMIVAAGYGRKQDLRASMIRWLQTATQHPGGVFRPDGGRASADDVVR